MGENPKFCLFYHPAWFFPYVVCRKFAVCCNFKLGHVKVYLKTLGKRVRSFFFIFNTPGVAWAVLQTPSPSINE